MVRILPQPQAGENDISLIDNPVAVAAVARFVIFPESKESIFLTHFQVAEAAAYSYQTILRHYQLFRFHCDSNR
jgi:hypothetical protein